MKSVNRSVGTVKGLVILAIIVAAIIWLMYNRGLFASKADSYIQNPGPAGSGGYTFYDLGALGDSRGLVKISDSQGQIVTVRDPQDNQGYVTALSQIDPVTNRPSAWKALTGLPAALTNDMAAMDVNDSGTIVGSSGVKAHNPHPFTYSKGVYSEIVLQDTGTMYEATATAINNANLASGYYYGPNVSSPNRAYRYQLGGQSNNISGGGILPKDIDDNGTMVGRGPGLGAPNAAISWTNGCFHGITPGIINAINKNGLIVGSSNFDPNGKPFKYSLGTSCPGPVPLPFTPISLLQSTDTGSATGVNDLDYIVGVGYQAGGQSYGWIQKNGSVQDISKLLKALPSGLKGGLLPTDIDNKSRIVGTYQLNGSTKNRAFLLVP